MTLSELALELPALKDEAKNLWGAGSKYIECWNESAINYLNVSLLDEKNYEPDWQYHFNKMLESPDPEQYLKENS